VEAATGIASAPGTGAAAAGDSPRNRTTGIVLAHDSNSAAWKAPLLTELSVALARAGFVVMRPLCSWKEVRRQRLVEKALDTAATSPYACNVDRWILAGAGQGSSGRGWQAGRLAGGLGVADALVLVMVTVTVLLLVKKPCVCSCFRWDHWLWV
jgi:predicted alpha/beta-hydrolase family hydrolase